MKSIPELLEANSKSPNARELKSIINNLKKTVSELSKVDKNIDVLYSNLTDYNPSGLKMRTRLRKNNRLDDIARLDDLIKVLSMSFDSEAYKVMK